uniref:hypothetical protein n=1 Tax=Pseudonocardia sp. CA-138482 TaxID=3240023 RepID=UPI003F4910F6
MIATILAVAALLLSAFAVAGVALLALSIATREQLPSHGARYQAQCGHELWARTAIELVGLADEHSAGCPACVPSEGAS